MTQHLTMEQLLSLRDGDSAQTARAHLDACPACAAEYDRLLQRVAALKALGARRPSRDRWPVVKARLVAERRRRTVRRSVITITAAAAALALAVGLRPGADNRPVADFVDEAPVSITALQEQSRQLEGMLAAYGTEGRVLDGRTAAVIADLEDRIALVDAGLMQARRVNAPAEDVQALWRGRVELMDALVNAHVARANYVGF